jgi:hypothetical protein
MNTPVLVLIAALTLTTVTDDLQSPSSLKARVTYQDTLQEADERRRMALKAAKEKYLHDVEIAKEELLKQFLSAKEVSLKQLQNELNVALEAKDLKKANEIDAAIKSTADKAPPEELRTPLAIDAEQAYETAVYSCDKEFGESAKIAMEIYLTQLQSDFDAAFISKDLKEANRIDAAIKSLKKEAILREGDKRIVGTPEVLVELWASDLGCLSGVTVGPGGAFGTAPYVYQVPEGVVLRITGRNAVETFATEFPSNRPGRIIFDGGEGPRQFQGDMFVSAPEMQAGDDQIYRVKPDRSASLFHTTAFRLTKGIAFGREGKSKTSLFAINTTRDCLLSISPSGSVGRIGSKITSHWLEDDLVITSDAVFGPNAYLTDQHRGKLLQLPSTGPATDFATVEAAMSIARGEGAYGDFLYVGTANGHVFRVNPVGEATLFLKDVAVPPDADIKGIDVENDQMWLTTDSGSLLKVTLGP